MLFEFCYSIFFLLWRLFAVLRIRRYIEIQNQSFILRIKELELVVARALEDQRTDVYFSGAFRPSYLSTDREASVCDGMLLFSAKVTENVASCNDTSQQADIVVEELDAILTQADALRVLLNKTKLNVEGELSKETIASCKTSDRAVEF
eukprot:Tbor_TRINITY_DN4213_c0_g1::TRINITY_DN4213_c0_g1_i4::g.24046::m.24046